MYLIMGMFGDLILYIVTYLLGIPDLQTPMMHLTTSFIIRSIPVIAIAYSLPETKSKKLMHLKNMVVWIFCVGLIQTIAVVFAFVTTINDYGIRPTTLNHLTV
jgi:hypothetical protein